MKKILFISLIVFFPFVTYGQRLAVTPDGLKNSDDSTKSYVIINADGKKAMDLYNNAIKYINFTYNDPRNTIKGKIEGENLIFITYIERSLQFSSLNFFAAMYTTELSFKDGKVRFEIVDIKVIYPPSNVNNYKNIYDPTVPSDPFPFVTNENGWGIYNKKRVLKQYRAKEKLESCINSKILDISEFLNRENKSDW